MRLVNPRYAQGFQLLGRLILMKQILIVATLFSFAGCAITDRREESSKRFDTSVKPLLEIYSTCMHKYAITHLTAAASPYQIGDAAAGYCSIAFSKLEQALIEHLQEGTSSSYQATAYERAKESAKELRTDFIRDVVQTVVEARTPASE